MKAFASEAVCNVVVWRVGAVGVESGRQGAAESEPEAAFPRVSNLVVLIDIQKVKLAYQTNRRLRMKKYCQGRIQGFLRATSRNRPTSHPYQLIAHVENRGGRTYHEVIGSYASNPSLTGTSPAH